jgi:hypothetical protein
MVKSENPGTKNVSELMKDVDSGDYVIPYFQRGFEWEPSMASELFQSILQDYYTGLLLFWDLDETKAEQEEWDPVWGASIEGIPQQAVLDGQQRLSSLYYAIYNPEKKFPSRKSYYVFYLDLVKALNEEYDEAVPYKYFRHHRDWDDLKDRDEWIEEGRVPLCILSADDPENPDNSYINSREFNQWSKRFIEEHSDVLPEDVIEFKVRDMFQRILNYNFVHYPLSSDRDIRDICNIFAKVNASGMTLSTFDLMNAFLYPYGVELRKDLWEREVPEALKSMDSSMNINILKIISLRKQNYCSSKYLYNLIPGEETVREEPDGTRYEEVLVKSGDAFEELWNTAVDYAEEARSIIMNTGGRDFGAIREEYIPYGTMLPVIAAVLWEYDGSVADPEFRTMLKRWYWAAVFSKDYGGSSDTVMGSDFRDWKEWISQGKTMEQIAKVDAEFIEELDLKSTDKGSGRYNGVICLLALNGPRDFYRGNILGTGDFTDHRINDHHIFPKKVQGIDRENIQSFDHYRDSIVNRTLILDETNNKIKRKRPSDYVEEMIKNHGSEDKVKDLLKEHFISESAYEYLLDDDFDNFVIEREKEIKRHVIENIGIKDEA